MILGCIQYVVARFWQPGASTRPAAIFETEEKAEMPVNTGGAVVLLSGGLDSSVLLHDVARRTDAAPLHALSLHYGQRHARELDCASFQARQARAATHEIIDLAVLAPVLAPGTALVRGGAEVPDLDLLSARDREQPPTYVPNRNMILLSVAAAYAEARGLTRVYYGAQAQDEYGYWDCTGAFLERINAALTLNRRNPIEVLAPYMDASKAELVRLGAELGVDFSNTWSCYRGGPHPCGTCPTCVERRNAFAVCGIEDPVLRPRG